MLAPRDRALLSAAVQRGFLSPAEAEALAARYAGPAGGILDALLHTGRLSAAQAEALRASSEAPPGSSGPPGTDRYRSGTASGATPGSDSSFAPRGWQPGGATPGTARYGGGTPGTGRWSEGVDTASQDTAGSRGGDLLSATQRLRGPQIPGVQLEEELGRGGMGAVFRGVHLESKRTVAIKVLLKAGERRVARFEREAQAMERLSHPNIIDLVMTGTDRGQPYIVMEYVTGGDLEQAKSEGLSTQRTLEVMAQVARAVDHAHRAGILHRDLKPANVLLDAGGEPRVTDFGLAKILDRETQLTQTNAVLGTPYYMAPEQVRGEGFSEKTDVYSLGVMLYELLTGEFPVVASNRIELFNAIQFEPPEPPHEREPSIPLVLSHFVLWALEKAPAKRPTCVELARGLEALAAGRAPALLPPSLRRPGLRRAGRLLAALVLLALAGAAVKAAFDWRAEQRAQAAAEAALHELESALGAARRARGRDLEAALAEAMAWRAAAEQRAAIPERARAAGAASWADYQGDERRRDALERAVEGLVSAGRSAEAAALARELAELLEPRAAALLRVDVLSRDPASAADAYAELSRLDPPPSSSAERRRVALALLRLHEPRRAAELLEAPSALRARAWRLAGELERAARDVEQAQPLPDDALALPLERARVEAAQGQVSAALARVEGLRAGADARWHAARARLLAKLERGGAALAAWAQAIELDPQLRPARGRLLLRLGHRRDGELDLAAGPQAPELELDLALSRWVGGGQDAPLAKLCRRLIADARRRACSPRLGREAARWLCFLELARGQVEQARRVSEGVEEPAFAARLLGWSALADGKSDEVPAVAGEDLAARELRARAAGATPAALEGLPAEDPVRLSLELNAAQLAGEEPRRLAELSVATLLAWRHPARPRAVPVPVASEPTLGARRELIERMFLEARGLSALGRADSSVAQEVELLHERLIALEPLHVGALVARGLRSSGTEALQDLLARYPHLDEPRLERIRRVLEPLERPELRREALLGPLRADFGVLELSPRLEPGKRVDCSWVARRSGDPERAYRLLRPLLEAKTHRLRQAFSQGIELARELKRPEAEIQRWIETLAQVNETRRSLGSVLRQADVGEDAALGGDAARALGRIKRDLPEFSRYFRMEAEARFGEGAWALADLSGGEYIARLTKPSTTSFALWLYGFGWNENAPQELIFELAAKELQQRPADLGPYLGQALFVGARYYHRLKGGEADPDDLHQALTLSRHALSLDPLNEGAHCLTLNFLVTARLNAEAEHVAARMDAISPECHNALFQRARMAALSGDARGAVQLLERVRPSSTTRRHLMDAPTWEPIRRSAEFNEFLAKLGIK